MPTASRSKAERTRAFVADIERERQRAYGKPVRGARAAARTVKVVAEGDSWFSYFPANDVLATLRASAWGDRRYVVHDRAKAGAQLNEMVYGRDMVDTFELLRKHEPDVFLFSGGGNDIAGPELFCMLFHKKAVALTAGLPNINRKVLTGIVHEIFGTAFQHMVDAVRHQARTIGRPDLPIVLHGYDYAPPDGRGWGWFGGAGPFPGPWLDPSLSRKGYDRATDATLRRTIVRELIDAFNAMQIAVAHRNRNVHHVDLRGTLSDRQWANELHPTAAGFKLVTARIESTLRTL